MWLLEEMNKRLSRKAHMNLLDFFHGFSTSDIEGSSSLGIRNSAGEVLHVHNLMICFSVSFSTSNFQGSSSLGTAHLLMEVLHAPKGLIVFDKEWKDGEKMRMLMSGAFFKSLTPSKNQFAPN